MLTDLWPLFGLVLRTPRLELRLPTLEQLGALGALAAEGVHDPAAMPFHVPWTDLEPPARARSVLQWQWRQWAELTPQRWSLGLVVSAGGEVLGVQEVSGRDFAVTREVGTGPGPPGGRCRWLVLVISGLLQRARRGRGPRWLGTANRVADTVVTPAVRSPGPGPPGGRCRWLVLVISGLLQRAPPGAGTPMAWHREPDPGHRGHLGSETARRQGKPGDGGATLRAC